MSHTWMSHVTHMDESCHTHGWVMSHTWMSHVTHMDESCHTLGKPVGVMLLAPTCRQQSCHSYQWVIYEFCTSHVWMRHVISSTNMWGSIPVVLAMEVWHIWICDTWMCRRTYKHARVNTWYSPYQVACLSVQQWIPDPARSVQDETRNGHRNANRNPKRNHETIVLDLFSLEILNRAIKR